MRQRGTWSRETRVVLHFYLCRVLIKVTEFPVCSLASSGLPNKAQTHHFLFVWTRVGEMHQSCQLSTMDLAVAQPRRGAPEK